jgi:general secretion pathway protein F
MPVYLYKAVNAEGGLVEGSLTAATERAAGRMVGEQGLILTALELSTARPRAPLFRFKQAKGQATLLAMQQLCTLLEAGVPLNDSLEAMAMAESNPFVRQALETMRGSLRQGSTFWQAMDSGGLPLPPYFKPLCRVGEQTGNLAQSLNDAVTRWQQDRQVLADIRNALIYPCILVATGIAALAIIFTSVVPKFVNLLDKSKGELPLLSTIVLGSGKFVNDNPLLFGGLLLALLVGSWAALRTPAARQRVLDWLARLPLLDVWMMEVNLGRWAFIMGTLLKNRVQLVDSLDIARENVSLTRLHSRLAVIGAGVRKGESLSDALLRAGTITPMGYSMVKVGEKSGELARMLFSLAEIYTSAGRQRTKNFLVVLEPLAILVIGAFIGLIMGGVLLAITSVNEMAI